MQYIVVDADACWRLSLFVPVDPARSASRAAPPSLPAPLTAAWRLPLLRCGASLVTLSLQVFTSELDAAVEAAGLRLRRLDKRSERALVFTQRKAWEAQVASAGDASTLVVPLLLARQHGRLVSLPGRALGAAVELLRYEKSLPEEGCALLAEFHTAVVEQLKLQSGGGGGSGEEQDVAAAALEQLVPRVRALVADSPVEAAGDA